MPLLDATGHYVADPYERGETNAAALTPWAEFSPGAGEAVEIANDTDIALIAPHLGALNLIAIGFPAYADGRGFTLARRLRHAGFAGRLRAVGPLIADQFAYALACGFDEIELPEASAARQPAEHWVKAAAAYSATYQRGYPRATNILDARRAARAGERNA